MQIIFNINYTDYVVEASAEELKVVHNFFSKARRCNDNYDGKVKIYAEDQQPNVRFSVQVKPLVLEQEVIEPSQP